MKNGRKVLVLLVSLITVLDAYAQKKNFDKDSIIMDDPFSSASPKYIKVAPAVMPQFNGDIQQYVFINSKDFKRNNKGLSGTVKIICTVRKNGEVSEARVIKSSSSTLDKEALRIVNAMPKWIPATMDGLPVDMIQIIDIVF